MIRTKRLMIQPYRDSDCAAMVKLLCNEHIKKTFMIPDFTTVQEAEELFYKGHMRRSDMNAVSILMGS